MIKPIQTLTILFLFAYFSSNASSESKWISLNLSNEDGMSNSAITSIFEDSEGLMWFGSWDGLNRYDGTNITVFKPDFFNRGSLSNNIIRKLLEDKHQNLWVVTNEGINRFLPNTMSFESYFSGNEYLPVREQNLIASIGCDSVLYVSLMRYGLYFFNETSNEFLPISLPGISDSIQKDIIGLSGGIHDNLYFLEQNGKVFSYQKKKSFLKLSENDLSQYENLNFEKHWFIKSENNTYLAIAIETGGLFLINLETDEIERIRKNDELLRVTTVNKSFEPNEFWIGSDDGSVYKLSLNNKASLISMNVNMPDLSSKKVKIWNINQTSEDMLWIGTDGNGVYRYITKGKPFFNIKKGDNETGSLGHNIVRSVFKDQTGNLWIGTRGDGLNKISADGSKRISYNVDNGLSNNAVLSLNMDKNKNLWIGVDGEGIDMLESSSGKIFHFPEDFQNKDSQEFGYVYSICIDVYGSIWLGTSGYGVVNMEVSRDRQGQYVLKKYQQIRYKQGIEGLRSDIVYSIVEERPNVLWLGTRGGGLHRLNTLNNSLEIFNVSNDIERGLLNDDVLSLCMAKNQKLWIGTSGGLSVLTLSYKPYRFIHYTERNGMPNNTVHAILTDAAQDIWISTNSGLAKLDLSSTIFQNFNKTDGLQNTEFTDGASFNDTISGLFYFGGTEGLDWFKPIEIVASNNFPPILLSEFRLNNNLVIPGDSTLILTKSLNATKELKLNYNQNFFSISFTTLNYYNPEKCQFAYYLEEFDKAWNYIGNQRTASFTNVPPGKYTLKVKATNEDGFYGNEIREVSIIVNPPYWNTFLAYLVYLLILGVIMYLLLKFLKRRAAERREVEMEKIERMKANEINHYKLQFFTNIAHEFRTPLTLILAPAAILKERLGEKKQLGQYARSIFQNANRLQKLISELIEFRKVETNNMKLAVGRYDLVQYISKLTKAFELYTDLNKVSLTFLRSKDIIEAWIDPEKFEKILLNLVSNAIKYTPSGGKVEIELLEKEDNIHLIIRDNGIGIPPEYLDNIFDRFYHHGSSIHESKQPQESGGVGLSLTKSLVELHKGSITASNRPVGGSEFLVIIPNRKEAFEKEIAENLHKPSLEKISMKVDQEFQFPLDYVNNEVINPEDDNREFSLLVVDDNHEVRNLVESLLIDKYFIFKAPDGITALKILNQESIDLVISDVIMPGIDGLELTKSIKSDINTSHIPVILLTARAEIDDRIEGLEVGADSYIPKPFTPRHLMVRIEKLIVNSKRLHQSFKVYTDKQYQNEAVEGLSTRDQELIANIIEFIEEKMQDVNLNAESLSAQMFMSKTQLYRKVKALTGLTPHGLIKYLRLTKAASILKQGEKTVSEVFYETGFNSRSYFYQTFKEAYGVSPGDYTNS
ncbi:MAG: response regulator [Bacteroidales bacterium]|nr:response regulator [Bacteroidales bacterium]MCF8390932.1 response regulator [Bacteroidales bacterium]